MRKILLLIFLAFVFISPVGCGQTSTANNNGFSEDKAIPMVIKDHPEFPSKKGDTLTKKLPIGGPSGTTANVKFTTTIEKSSANAYIVTLTKDWGITVNDKYAKSYWRYKVTPENVTLLEKIDNDYLPEIMK